MKKIIKCKDCGKDIEIDTHAKYKKKYCTPCSKKRKKDYDNLYKVCASECDDG